MDSAQKFIQLLQELRDATREGRVAWEETVDEETFTVKLADGFLNLASREGRYFATLYSSKGRMVNMLVPEEPAAIELFRDLFVQARQSARHFDDLIDRMISAVKTRTA
jgi:hypothetical protein